MRRLPHIVLIQTEDSHHMRQTNTVSAIGFSALRV